MKRFQEKYLDKWKNKTKRKPLIIRGARQVGKSTLVRNYCKKQKLNLFELNLERNLKLKSLFESYDLKELLNEIEIICGKRGIFNENSILFLDEIQAIPAAISALRYFYEDFPKLKVLAAGSLLEFVLSKHSFSMPVGRIEYCFMGPMTFEEFLTAKGKKLLLDYLENFDFNSKFSETVHQQLIALQKDYFLVGGMPEAVQLYVSGKSFEEISDVQTSILETYIDDFAKYAKGQALENLQSVFNFVGGNFGQKIKYASINPDVQSRELKYVIRLLQKAKVIFPVYCSMASGLPLSVFKKEKIYKLFFLDIGLANKISGTPNLSIEKTKSIDFINKGAIAEQFIAQHLLALENENQTPQLFYWLREGKKNNAEVDFVSQINGNIIPIEVKAGAKGSLKSLHRFVFEKNCKTAVRFDLNFPSIQNVETKIINAVDNKTINFKLFSLPIYMVGQLKRLLN